MPSKGSGKGTRVHAEGYIQIIRRGPWRGWLEHRKVMLEACREFCYYPVDGNLPEGLTVEHLDHVKIHNCRENLMLLDKRIHDAISIAFRWRQWREAVARVEAEVASEVAAEREGPPDWVMEGETSDV